MPFGNMAEQSASEQMPDTVLATQKAPGRFQFSRTGPDGSGHQGIEHITPCRIGKAIEPETDTGNRAVGQRRSGERRQHAGERRMVATSKTRHAHAFTFTFHAASVVSPTTATSHSYRSIP